MGHITNRDPASFFHVYRAQWGHLHNVNKIQKSKMDPNCTPSEAAMPCLNISKICQSLLSLQMLVWPTQHGGFVSASKFTSWLVPVFSTCAIQHWCFLVTNTTSFPLFFTRYNSNSGDHSSGPISWVHSVLQILYQFMSSHTGVLERTANFLNQNK